MLITKCSYPNIFIVEECSLPILATFFNLYRCMPWMINMQPLNNYLKPDLDFEFSKNQRNPVVLLKDRGNLFHCFIICIFNLFHDVNHLLLLIRPLNSLCHIPMGLNVSVQLSLIQTIKTASRLCVLPLLLPFLIPSSSCSQNDLS